MIAMVEYRLMRTRTVRRYVLAPTKYRQFGMRAFRCDVSRARRTGSLRWNIDMFERACVDLEVFVSIIEFEDGGATASAVIPARDLEMRSLEDTQRSPGLTVAHQASLTTSRAISMGRLLIVRDAIGVRDGNAPRRASLPLVTLLLEVRSECIGSGL